MINDWREKTKTCTAQSKANAEVEKKSVKFYKSTRSGLMQKTADKTKTIIDLPTIMLSSKTSKLACASSTEKQQPERESMKDNKENSARNDQPKKKLKTSGDALVTLNNVETLEDDFIKQYLNYDKQWKPAQRKCSLLESLDQVR